MVKILKKKNCIRKLYAYNAYDIQYNTKNLNSITRDEGLGRK